MNIVQSVVLGIVQGLTEFLPISSTAHMNLVPQLLGWEKPGAAAEAVIQLGTVAAVIAYFWKDLVNVAFGLLRSLRPGAGSDTAEARIGKAILVGTLPICIAGVLLDDYVETVFRGNGVIATMLIVMALLLWLAEVVAKRTRSMADIDVRDGWLVGLAQAIALVPGTSRSGATLTAALFLNLNREAAARFSFLLSVPAIVLAGLYKMKDVLRPEAVPPGGAMTWSVPDIAIATVVSGIVGYASIAFLLRYLRTHNTLAFVFYRLVLGVIVLYLVRTGFLP